MNKVFLPPLALLAVMLLFCIWNGTALSRESAQWQAQVTTAGNLAKFGDWHAASAALEESYTAWTNRQRWLHIVCRHDAIDGAEAMYRRAMAFAGERESSEFQAETAELTTQLRLLAEMERLSLKNIL